MYNLDARDIAINIDIWANMLEQRRAKEKGYITLKEAAEISDYSPDYVGQLIRAGKIKGEQVYSTVAWVTTVDEVEAYLHNKNRSVADQSETTKRMGSYATYSLYALIGILVFTLLILQYIFYVSLDKQFSDELRANADGVEIIPETTLVYE